MDARSPSSPLSPISRHKTFLLFFSTFAFLVVVTSYVALTGFVQGSKRTLGGRNAYESSVTKVYQAAQWSNLDIHRRHLLNGFPDVRNMEQNAHLVNGIEINEDYHTKLLMIRNIVDNGEVKEHVELTQETSPIPSTRSHWLKSITSIFNGMPVTDAGDEADARSPYIVVFKNSSSVEQLRGICMQYGVYVKSNMNCNMPEVCRRVYASTFRGVSGFFSQQQLQKLLSCFEDTVDFVEKDRVVYKAEDVKKKTTTAHKFDSSTLYDPGKDVQVSREMRDIGDSFQNQLQGSQPSDSGLPSPDGRDGRVRAFSGITTQDLNVALWNLDRIDQRSLPLDQKFRYSGRSRDDGTGKGVTIYTVDSGLRTSHQEFKDWNGANSRASHGWDFVDDDPHADDCDGHGTHVAGTAVGRTTGVAKSAKVVGVRVLDCAGSGSVSDVVAGLDWVATHHEKPAIVTMSLGISVGSWSRALEEAVKNLVNEYGITVIVASGNSGVDSCYVAPGNVDAPITVAASDLSTKFGKTSTRDQESLYRWSNTGECIDIFAPGVDIYSACGGDSRCDAVSDTAYAWASGTSMAVPLVAGVAATYLAEYPDASPEQVKSVILNSAITGKLSSPHMKPGSPNLLLHSKLTPRVGTVVAAG
jgi:subtilisin family serine protease